MLEALAVLRAARPCPPDARAFAGAWELAFTSSLARAPLVGGYMPTSERLVWDLRRDGSRSAATLPFLPAIEIRGEGLTYADAVLTYTVGGKAPSTWEVFHADGDVVVAVSSATAGTWSAVSSNQVPTPTKYYDCLAHEDGLCLRRREDVHVIRQWRQGVDVRSIRTLPFRSRRRAAALGLREIPRAS